MTIGHTGLSVQPTIISAAIKAGVKRFIPSEFGGDTTNPKSRAIPYFKDKVQGQELLTQEVAKNGGKGLSYSLVITGPFLDWGLKVGFGLNLNGKSVTIVDDGKKAASHTTVEAIGKAVAGVLQHPDETKNRAVYVQSVSVSQEKLLALSKQVKGADGWDIKTISAEESVAKGWAELKKPEPNHLVAFTSFIEAAIWSDGYGSRFEKLDNGLLGVPQLDDEELLQLIKSLAE